MSDDLPVGYYLDNFFALLDFVGSRYHDLLTSEERTFSLRFRKLPTGAQRLYVRLASRKGPLFRSDKITYPEVPSTPTAARELAGSGFLKIEPPATLEQMLDLLKVAEIRGMLAASGTSTPPANRAELLDHAIRSLSESSIRSHVRTLFRIYEPLGAEVIRTYRLLFFGNLRQDLSAFVIRDLGHMRYEEYPLSPDGRLYETRDIIEANLALLALRQELRDGLDADDRQIVLAIPERLPDPLGEPKLVRLRDSILNTIARQMEREGRHEGALALYGQAVSPPSRERSVRILANLGRKQEALALCRRITEAPLDESECQFGPRFAPRLLRKLGRTAAVHTERIDIPIEELSLEHPLEPGPEEAVLQHYRSLGWGGFHTENRIWLAIFGLAFWDIIFMPVRGAFHNPFQMGPADLFSPSFRVERAGPIGERLEHITRCDEWPRSVLEVYRSKNGIANHLVRWRYVPEQLIATALERVSRADFAVVFDRISRNIGAYKRGLPDLLLFPPEADERAPAARYLLAEVKAGADQLRAEQRGWIQYLISHAVPCRIIRVRGS